jgi:hypothetical protein
MLLLVDLVSISVLPTVTHTDLFVATSFTHSRGYIKAHTWFLLGLSDHLFPVFVNLKLVLMVWEVLGFFEIPEAHAVAYTLFCALTSK